MERNPHLLIEGCAIACYAIGAKVAYIYIRGEFYHVQEVLEATIAEAYKAGYLGKNIFGSGFDCDVYVHRGAGAYEAGEETALIESLEGKRAQPRIKPPFPAVAGLYQCPTAVNNVETLCNVPLDRAQRAGVVRGARPGEERRAEAVLHQRPRQAPGRLRSVDAHDAARADLRRRSSRRACSTSGTFKAIIPGGSSVPLLLDEDLDTPASFDHIQKAGSLLGSAGLIVLDDIGLHGLAGDEPAALLPSRVVRQVHAVPRGRRLALQAADARRARRGADEGHRPALRRRQQHRRQDAVRVRRRGGDAGADDAASMFRHEFEAHVREGRCTLPAEWRAKQPMLAGAH